MNPWLSNKSKVTNRNWRLSVWWWKNGKMGKMKKYTVKCHGCRFESMENIYWNIWVEIKFRIEIYSLRLSLHSILCWVFLSWTYFWTSILLKVFIATFKGNLTICAWSTTLLQTKNTKNNRNFNCTVFYFYWSCWFISAGKHNLLNWGLCPYKLLTKRLWIRSYRSKSISHKKTNG